MYSWLFIINMYKAPVHHSSYYNSAGPFTVSASPVTGLWPCFSFCFATFQKGIFQCFSPWGAVWGSPPERTPAARWLTGCPGSVITVLMLSVLKVQYCDNWRMAAILPPVRRAASRPEGRPKSRGGESNSGGTQELAHPVPARLLP